MVPDLIIALGLTPALFTAVLEKCQSYDPHDSRAALQGSYVKTSTQMINPVS